MGQQKFLQRENRVWTWKRRMLNLCYQQRGVPERNGSVLLPGHSTRQGRKAGPGPARWRCWGRSELEPGAQVSKAGLGPEMVTRIRQNPATARQAHSERAGPSARRELRLRSWSVRVQLHRSLSKGWALGPELKWGPGAHGWRNRSTSCIKQLTPLSQEQFQQYKSRVASLKSYWCKTHETDVRIRPPEAMQSSQEPFSEEDSLHLLGAWHGRLLHAEQVRACMCKCTCRNSACVMGAGRNFWCHRCSVCKLFGWLMNQVPASTPGSTSLPSPPALSCGGCTLSGCTLTPWQGSEWWCCHAFCSGLCVCYFFLNDSWLPLLTSSAFVFLCSAMCLIHGKTCCANASTVNGYTLMSR